MPLQTEHKPITHEYLREQLDVAVRESAHYLRRASNQTDGSLPQANDTNMSKAWAAHADMLMRADAFLADYDRRAELDARESVNGDALDGMTDNQKAHIYRKFR